MAYMESKNKFIFPSKMSKKKDNLTYLIRLGVPFDKALAICGFTKEEGNVIRDKVSLSLDMAGLNSVDESLGDDTVDIEVSVGNDGIIRRKYEG
jgi:hypothetical protein